MNERIPMKFYNKIDYVVTILLIIFCAIFGNIIQSYILFEIQLALMLCFVLGCFLTIALVIWVVDNTKRGKLYYNKKKVQ